MNHGLTSNGRGNKKVRASWAIAAKRQDTCRHCTCCGRGTANRVDMETIFDKGGMKALRAVCLRGRPAQLDESQREELRRAIVQNPTEHGLGTELWTLKRVGVVIKLHGVAFSHAQIWRILGFLGFSPQKSEKRALERTEDGVCSWKRNTWPRLKKAQREGRMILETATGTYPINI